MQGQPYSAPASYPPAQHQQQPLFIIIPSGGKSHYKARPQVYSPPAPYDYAHAHYAGHRAARRLAPYLRRRSGSLLARKRPAPANKEPTRAALESGAVESVALVEPVESAEHLGQARPGREREPRLKWLAQSEAGRSSARAGPSAHLDESKAGAPANKLTSGWPALMRPEHKLLGIGERPPRRAPASATGRHFEELLGAGPTRPLFLDSPAPPRRRAANAATQLD